MALNKECDRSVCALYFTYVTCRQDVNICMLSLVCYARGIVYTGCETQNIMHNC